MQRCSRLVIQSNVERQSDQTNMQRKIQCSDGLRGEDDNCHFRRKWVGISLLLPLSPETSCWHIWPGNNGHRFMEVDGTYESNGKVP